MGMAVLLACVVVMLLLTAIPHAILLSATGDLFPSPFSASLIPVAAFSVCASSIVYGIVAGTFQSLSDVYNALLYGIRWAAPVFLFYILVMQLYESLRFVFG
jgi:aminobenzoyl-glutamate transport protein